ncbi:profilin-2-like [Petromyzon marinus]|uniref:Profilin n=1 Tax=Petromyzon marinus TaxID=7757 RepID=A0AAJ7XIZ4_PETMA|nr:profilin-2-like [Petromyzon marinus]
MSWNSYVENLMAMGKFTDAAVVGIATKTVWASHGKLLANITAAELDVILGKDRQKFFINGLTLGGAKCSVLRDQLNLADDWTMDLKTKSAAGEPTLNISIASASKALVVAVGKDGVHGGEINTEAFKVARYLRDNGY